MHIIEKTINKGFAIKAQAQMQLEAADAANRMHMQREREREIEDKTTHGHCCICLTHIDNGGAMSMYGPSPHSSQSQTRRQKSEKPCRLMLHFPFWPQSRGALVSRAAEATTRYPVHTIPFPLSRRCANPSPFSTSLQGIQLAAMMSTMSIFSPWHAPYLLAPLFMQCALPQ